MLYGPNTTYDAEQQAALQRTALASSCTSWYKRGDGRIVNNWHAGVEQYRARTREIVLDDYELLARVRVRSTLSGPCPTWR